MLGAGVQSRTLFALFWSIFGVSLSAFSQGGFLILRARKLRMTLVMDLRSRVSVGLGIVGLDNGRILGARKLRLGLLVGWRTCNGGMLVSGRTCSGGMLVGGRTCNGGMLMGLRGVNSDNRRLVWKHGRCTLQASGLRLRLLGLRLG